MEIYGEEVPDDSYYRAHLEESGASASERRLLRELASAVSLWTDTSEAQESDGRTNSKFSLCNCGKRAREVSGG